MKYVDAHLHLADPALPLTAEGFVKEADAVGVKALVTAGMSSSDAEQSIALARRYAPLVKAAIGIHPWTVVGNPKVDSTVFRSIVQQERGGFVAIGEIGLDGKYSDDATLLGEQRRVFREMLVIAGENSLPVVVHSRLAIEAVLDDLAKADLPRVLLHWYSGPVELLRTISDRGYAISIGPSVAYSKRSIGTAKAADIEMILTETDAPVEYYGPFKGRATSAAFIPEIVGHLARIKDLPEQDVALQLQRNFERVFGLKV